MRENGSRAACRSSSNSCAWISSRPGSALLASTMPVTEISGFRRLRLRSRPNGGNLGRLRRGSGARACASGLLGCLPQRRQLVGLSSSFELGQPCFESCNAGFILRTHGVELGAQGGYRVGVLGDRWGREGHGGQRERQRVKAHGSGLHLILSCRRVILKRAPSAIPRTPPEVRVDDGRWPSSLATREEEGHGRPLGDPAWGPDGDCREE